MFLEQEYDADGNIVDTQLPPEPEEGQDVVEELPEPAYAAPQEQVFQKAEMQKSFSDLRRAKEAAERERDEMRRLLEERNKPQPVVAEDYSINDDELVEGRTLNSVRREIQQLKQDLQQQQQKTTQQLLDQRILREMPDFESVVNTDTVAKLKEVDPVMYRLLASAPDGYDKAESAYKMMQNFGIVQKNDGLASLARIRSNTSKPRTATSIQSQQGDTPLTKANAFSQGLTPELKERLLREMNEAIRNKN